MLQETIEKLSIFSGLSRSDQQKIRSRLSVRSLARGENLFESGTAASSLYFVRYGQFRVVAPRMTHRELCSGDLIGAEAFFAQGSHQEAVTASRASEVFELSRDDYAILLADVPGFAAILLAAFARQSHDRTRSPTSGSASGRDLKRKPSVVVVPLCGGDAWSGFLARLRDRLPSRSALLVDQTAVATEASAHSPSDWQVAHWFDRQMASGRQLVFLADDPASPWTDHWLDHADEVVIVTEGPVAAVAEHSLLDRVLATFEPAVRRLVRLHPERQGVVTGTAAWLERIPVAMHHHVSLQDDDDIDALIRFLTGAAVGFVGGGGGGLGSAYSGIYRALDEYGIRFDFLLGTSVGSSMLAGLAYLGDHQTLTEGTEYIFVRQRSFRKLTVPRHSLLDHKTFDRALQDTYGARTRIEDCWKPYAAIATNLSARRIELIRTGLLWHAVRASTAIPCVLPPFITEDGMLLVDGSIMNDAPLDVMRELKSGPNVVVHFGRTDVRRMNDLVYADLPGRSEVIRSLLKGGKPRKRVPSIISMLYRTMLAHQNYDIAVGPDDLVLNPPAFPGASMINFDNHRAVTRAAYEWARDELPRLSETKAAERLP